MTENLFKYWTLPKNELNLQGTVILMIFYRKLIFDLQNELHPVFKPQ